MDDADVVATILKKQRSVPRTPLADPGQLLGKTEEVNFEEQAGILRDRIREGFSIDAQVPVDAVEPASRPVLDDRRH